MFYVIPNNFLKVSLNTIKLVTMFYVIPDTLLEVLLNTKKTGHHVLSYAWHIVESVAKHQ